MSENEDSLFQHHLQATGKLAYVKGSAQPKWIAFYVVFGMMIPKWIP